MIEQLEARIAPAAVATFFEADGDKVTVKSKFGTSASLQDCLQDQNGNPIAVGQTGVTSFQINLLKNATIAAEFEGTDLEVSASGGTGDTAKLVNAVSINAFGGNDANSIDLGKVTVKGNLIYIDAGDSDINTPAIKTLDVTSMGPVVPGNSATISEIQGDITKVNIKTFFNGYIASKVATGAANFRTGLGSDIGSFTVGTSVGTEEGNDVGHLEVRSIKSLTVKNTILGSFSGASTDRGLIEARNIEKLSITKMVNNAKIIVYT